ncbi:MAG: PQQ-dependent sugar dehydrogenase [Gammaproteobacteria bacterium]|nr:PQQ-dependent sugar dehydrogenase [Gammaproteobacteria bacterium]
MNSITALAVAASLSGAAHAQLAPELVEQSNTQILVEHIGTQPAVIRPGFFGPTPNIASPVSIRGRLHFIDQNDAIYRAGGNGKGQIKPMLRLSDELGPKVGQPPEGLDLNNRQAILNVSAGKNDTHLYVMHTSNTEPVGNVPIYRLPAPLSGECFSVGNICDDLFRISPTEYQVLTEYRLRGGELIEPRMIATFEAQSGPTHHGGGMLTLQDGRILYATGDALYFGNEGRAAAQDIDEITSKLLIIDPQDGSFEVAAVGLRNVQRLMLDDDGKTLGLADIGGVTAEEINFASLVDIVDTSEVENFGWGRNSDGLAREGTFYVGEGIAGVGFSEPPALGAAPIPEAGFIQPYAEYGRDDKEDPNGGRASSGPVTSGRSFAHIAALWSDLASGKAYFSLDALDQQVTPVYLATLVNENGERFGGFNSFAGLFRTDPRMFRFPNGTAGVILEATGDFYRLTEIGNN